MSSGDSLAFNFRSDWSDRDDGFKLLITPFHTGIQQLINVHSLLRNNQVICQCRQNRNLQDHQDVLNFLYSIMIFHKVVTTYQYI